MSYQTQRRDARGRFMSLQWVYVPVEPTSETAKMCHRFVTTKKRT